MSNQVVSIPGVNNWKRVWPNGTVVGSGSDVVANARYFFENRPDRVRTRKPTGWLYPKGYELSMNRYVMPHGTMSRDVGGGVLLIQDGALGTTTSGGPFQNWPALSGSDISRAEIKALEALKEQKVNLGVAFAECQQTADLVGSSASKIGRSFSQLAHGQFRKAAQTLGVNPRHAPRHWLELQYGWKPLLSDVYGAIDSLQRTQSEHWVVTTKGAVKNVLKADTLFQDSARSTLRKESGFSGVFVRLDYEPGNTFLSSLANVGMTNPLEVLWEKVPYSFVVDWFLPIGGWLGSMDAAYGWRFKSGSRSEFRKKIVSVTSAGVYYPVVACSYAGNEKYVDLKRTVYSSSPLPRFPGLKNPVSLAHAANGLSLLAQAFGRSPTRGVR